MKYTKAFLLSAILLCSTTHAATTSPVPVPVPAPCELSQVSYNLPVKVDISAKGEVIKTPALLTFSLCKVDSLITEFEKYKAGSFRKSAYDFLFFLYNNDSVKFKTFFEDEKEDMAQFGAYLGQFSPMIKKQNLKFEKVYVSEAIEDDNWVLYGMNLKGKGGNFPIRAIFKKNAKKQIKSVSSMKAPNPMVNNLYSAFVAEKPIATRPTEDLTHILTIESYANKTPIVQLEFNTLSNASVAYISIEKLFKQLVGYAQKNNKKAFLANVKNPESYQKIWGFAKNSPELKQLADYWKNLSPIAALDLNPVYIVYFADQTKTNVVHIYRFLKVDEKMLLLSELIDLNQELYRLPQMKAAALEPVPFSSLKKVIDN